MSEATIVTDGRGGVTVEDAGDEFGTFGIGVLAAIVECVPCQSLPEGVTVAHVEPGDEPLQDRVTVQYDVVREHAVECQSTFAVFSGEGR